MKNPEKDMRELEKLNDTDCKKLADAILKVYKYLQTSEDLDKNAENPQQKMAKLKKSVKDTVASLNAFVNQLDSKKDCHTYLMAIQFYLMNDPVVQKKIFRSLMFSQPFNFDEDDLEDDENIMGSCRNDLEYIMFCMDKALQNIHSFKGSCFRRIKANDREKDYY